jgi:hypothetical protein
MEEIGKVDNSFLDSILLFVMKQALEVSTFLVQDLHWLKQRLWLCWQPLPIKMEIQSLMLV